MEDLRNEINQLIIEADSEIQAGRIDSGISKYNEAKEMSQKINWQDRIVQIDEIISEIRQQQEKEMKQEIMHQEIEKERLAKLEKEKRMEEALSRMKSKKEEEKQKRMDELRKKKENETLLSNQAYDLLESGSNALNDDDFDVALQSFNKAKKIFEEIKWVTEIRRCDEFLSDAQEKKNQYQRTLDLELKKKQLLEQNLKNEQLSIERSEKTKGEVQASSLELQIQLEETAKIEQNMRNLAMSLLDEANLMTDEKQFDLAIEKVREAKELFLKMGWSVEADRTFAQIAVIREKQKKWEKLKELEKEKQLRLDKEKEELEKRVENSQKVLQMKKQDEEKKLLKEKQDQQYAKTISDEVFQEIEKLESKVRNYESEVKKGKILDIECPYSEAINVYQKGMKELRDIGWSEQSNHLSEGVRAYQEKLVKDKKLRTIEQIKIERKEQEELELKKQIQYSQIIKEKKEREEQEIRNAERMKNEKEKAIHNKCLKLLDDANLCVNNLEYPKAIEIYNEVIQNYQDIEYFDGVRITKDTLLKVEKQFEESKIHLELKQKALEDKVLEQKKLEEKIKLAEQEDEKQKLELKKKILESRTKKEKEETIQNQIISLLEIANELTKKKLFDDAIMKYDESIELLDEINWPLKRDQILDALNETKHKKDIYLSKIQALEEKRAKDAAEALAFQEKLEKEAAEKQKRIDAARKIALEKQNTLKNEKELSENAWKLLDDADASLKSNKSYLALYFYHHAYFNFTEINWIREAETTKKKLRQIFNTIKNPLVDLEEILNNNNLSLEKECFTELSNCLLNRKSKDFQSALKHLQLAQNITGQLKWSNSFNIIQSFNDVLLKEDEKYQIQLQNKLEIPNEENAMRLLDEAKVKVSKMQYDAAIILGEKSSAMFEQMGWVRESNMVKQEIARWKFKTEKIHEQIYQAKANVQNNPPLDQQDLTEEERKKILIEERKRLRRESRNQ